jgi:hypothetical protein
MAFNQNEPKYRINYVSGGNPNDRRDTLVGGGPLKVASVHYLAVVLPQKYVSDIGGGERQLYQHTMEYIELSALLWDAELLDRNLAWAMLPGRSSRLLAKLDSLGVLDWTPVKSIGELAARLYKVIKDLDEVDRALTLADVVAYPVPANPS